MTRFTAILAPPDVDGVACCVIAARSAGGPFQTFFLESMSLGEFFSGDTQGRLPRLYTLLVCGLEMARMNWQGELLRPPLMEALRSVVGTVLWFSNRTWHPEDRAAVANIIGEENLTIEPSAPCTAQLVSRRLVRGEEAYAEKMVQFASGALPQEEEERWGVGWRRVVAALRADPARLPQAIQPLMDGHPERLPADLVELSMRVESENRRIAERGAAEPVPVRGYGLVRVEVPPGRHAFWREIAAYARAQTGATFALCHLAGLPALILCRGEDSRADLRPWARYLTDMLASAQAVFSRPEAVAFSIAGLPEDLGLVDVAIDTLRDGSHLLV